MTDLSTLLAEIEGKRYHWEATDGKGPPEKKGWEYHVMRGGEVVQAPNYKSGLFDHRRSFRVAGNDIIAVAYPAMSDEELAERWEIEARKLGVLSWSEFGETDKDTQEVVGFVMRNASTPLEVLRPDPMEEKADELWARWDKAEITTRKMIFEALEWGRDNREESVYEQIPQEACRD